MHHGNRQSLCTITFEVTDAHAARDGHGFERAAVPPKKNGTEASGRVNWAKHIRKKDEKLGDEIMVEWMKLQSLKSNLFDEITAYHFAKPVQRFEETLTKEFNRSSKEGRVSHGVGQTLLESWEPVELHISLQHKNANMDTATLFVSILKGISERQNCL